MLTERDAYMARGLDAINEFDVTVAVMGIAHQDGVERNLQTFGWQNARLNCGGVAKFSILS
jgi:pheromone shutdown protein TraB